MSAFFLEKIHNIFSHALPNANKIKFDGHCVIGQHIREKHVKHLRDFF